MRADECIALDRLLPDGLIRLLEHAFPRGGAVGGDGIFRRGLDLAVLEPLDVVVPVDEQLLDGLASRPPAAGERLLPRIGHAL